MELRTQRASAIIRSGAVMLFLAVALMSCGGNKSSSTTDQSSTANKAAAPASSGLPANSWVVPVDVANASPSPGPSQSDWTNFAWQTFVALNWPALPASPSGVSGLPDTSQQIGASSSNNAMIPTVWLTYRADSNTMLAGAQDPGPWSNNPVSLPQSCGALTSTTPVSPGFQPMYLDLITKFGNVDEATGSPLVEQTGWYVTYDIRLDQSEYTYIQLNGYYNGTNQMNAQPNNFVGLPQTGTEPMFSPSPLPSPAQFGALEVKAAWRVLDPNTDEAVIPRYYTQTGYFLQPDGTTCSGPTLFGLIGMHILRLTPTTPATWFWATFEHVDNVTAPPGSPEPATLATANTPNGNCPPSPSSYNVAPTAPPSNVPWNNTNSPVNVCRVTPIADDAQQANQTWQGNLAGTVWANYQLVGTINPAPSPGPQFSVPPPPANSTPVNTDTLANTTMETYFQKNGTSCLTCHAQAAPQGVNQQPPTTANQIFTFVLSDAVVASPGPALSATAPHAKPAHRQRKLPPRVLELLRQAHATTRAPGPSPTP
jgi:hypothetical protein